MDWINTIQRLTPPLLQESVRHVKGGCQIGGSPLIMTAPSIGSYSQYHEDLIIDAILGCHKEGFYIDVGANHPQILSNTKRFYDKGWRGVNIEPNPTMFGLLQEERKNDVNLNIGLGREKGERDFFLLDPDTLSSFNPLAVKKMLRSPGIRLVSTSHIEVNTLDDVCERYTSGRTIDFMSLDVEGCEDEVIAGGDWQKFRPRLLLMEINQRGEGLIETLQKIGYRLVFSNGTNGIFMDDELKPQ